MPKTLDYPRSSLRRSLGLADAVDQLGGSCTEEMCADRMGKQLSGAFSALMSAAARYGLVTRRKGQLAVTPLYKDYKLAYTDEEAHRVLQSAFLKVPLFTQIVNRFAGKKLPIDIFDKLLVKEFDVGEKLASRVAKYFIDGAKTTDLLRSDNTLVASSDSDASGGSSGTNGTEGKPPSRDDAQKRYDVELPASGDDFVIRFTGPGLDSTVRVTDEDDLLMVDAMMTRIKKKLGVATEPRG